MPTPNSPAPQNSLAQLTQALQQATQAMNNLTRAQRGARAPGGPGGGAGGGGAFMGGVAGVAGRAAFGRIPLGMGSLMYGGPAGFAAAGAAAIGGAVVSGGDSYLANLVASGGNSSMAGGAAARGAIDALGAIPIIGAATGARAASEVLDRTQGRLNRLADMARQGIEIDDDMIQREASVVIEQEKRAQNVEARIAGTLGSAENIRAAGPDAVERSPTGIQSLVDIGERILKALPSLGGGS